MSSCHVFLFLFLFFLFQKRLVLAAVDEESLLERLLLLAALVDGLASTLCVTAKDELGLELPLLRDVPVGLCLLVNDGVVVLEVGGAAFGLEGGPEVVLGHGWWGY